MVGEGAFADTTDIVEGDFTDIAFLENGTESGNPTIGLRIKVPVGDMEIDVFAQTTWRLLHGAVRAFEARYGVPT